MGDNGVVFKCHAGCKKEAILEALKLSWPNVFNNGGKRSGDVEDDSWMPCRMEGCDGHKVAEYRYVDEKGKLLYAVARCSKKGQGCQGFRQWMPDASKRYGKKWGVPSTVRRVLYHLPAVISAAKAGRRIFLMEGEKDADRLRADYPLETATTLAQGAGGGKWKPEFAKYFKGASEVIIVADCDKAGLDYAEEVHRSLGGVVVKVIAKCSPLMFEGADFSDHRDHGLSLEELEIIPFQPVRKRPRMVIEVEEQDRERQMVFAGYGQESLEKSLIGSMLKDGNTYNIAPIDIATTGKPGDGMKLMVKAIASLFKQGHVVSPETVALEIEEIASGSYDRILEQLLKLEKVAFSDTKKPEKAARILRERTIRRHIGMWLNATIRRLSDETTPLEDLLDGMRQMFERHAQEYVDLSSYCEPVGDVFSGDVIEEVIMEEIEAGGKASVSNVRPIRREDVLRPRHAAGQSG